MISSVPPPDPGQPAVSPEALDGIIHHVAVAAVKLQRFVGHPVGHPGGKELGHGDLFARELSGVDLSGHVVSQLAGGFDLGGQLRQPVPDGLELADGPPKLGPLLDILDRFVQGNLRPGHGGYRPVQALGLQFPHDVVEALPLLAQDIFGGNPAILKDEFGGIR